MKRWESVWSLRQERRSEGGGPVKWVPGTWKGPRDVYSAKREVLDNYKMKKRASLPSVA